MAIDKDMVRKINESHDTILQWKPVMKRLSVMAQPDGVFDKMGKLVERHDEQIKNNSNKIKWMYGILGSLIVATVGVVLTLVFNN